METKFFKDQYEFRTWLKEHHQYEKELIVGFYKVNSGKNNMSWSESVDQALCFGWIDGIRRSIDDESYSIRFTPRKPTSNWSAINIAKVEELIKKGLMHQSGLDAFEKRDKKKSNTYSFENELRALSAELLEIFMKNKTAWLFFEKQAHSYKKNVIHWIESAKKKETKLNRLHKIINASEHHKKL